MKLCCLSDLHGTLPEIPPCELVCICGDIVPLNIQVYPIYSERWLLNDFIPWINSLPCDKVFFIAGNHDFLMYRYSQDIKELFPSTNKATYLCHEDVIYISKEAKTYRIFGTPYCHKFGHWVFMRNDKELEKLYSEIPKNLDILLVHDEAYGYGDILLQDVDWNTQEHIGNKPLAQAVLEKQPRYMFTGHLHSCDHNCVMIKDTKRYNVSIKDENYRVVYDPLLLDI